MLSRFILVAGGIAAGLAAASMVPQFTQTTQSVIASAVPFARLNAQKPSSSAEQSIPKAHVEGEDEEAHANEESTKDGFIKLSQGQANEAGIRVAKASPGTLARYLTVPGTIVPAADRVGRVAAKVVGTVAEMRKQLGDVVEAGEVVAAIDSREVADAKSEYLGANVNFDLQKTLFAREQSLFEKKISAEQQFLRAQTTFAEVRLRVELARQKLAALGVPDQEITALSLQSQALQRYELRAPVSGKIVERVASLGAAVGGEGQPKELYGIADLTVLWVDLAVSPRDLVAVKEGQSVEITSGGAADRISGKVVFKSPILNSESRTARVVAQIPNKSGFWQPGAFVTAAIGLEEQKSPLVVPKSALQTVGKDQVVFVRVSGGFEKREVVIGRSDAHSREIVFGLAPGEEVAVAGSFSLKAELGKAEASHAH